MQFFIKFSHILFNHFLVGEIIDPATIKVEVYYVVNSILVWLQELEVLGTNLLTFFLFLKSHLFFVEKFFLKKNSILASCDLKHLRLGTTKIESFQQCNYQNPRSKVINFSTHVHLKISKFKHPFHVRCIIIWVK